MNEITSVLTSEIIIFLEYLCSNFALRHGFRSTKHSIEIPTTISNNKNYMNIFKNKKVISFRIYLKGLEGVYRSKYIYMYEYIHVRGRCF